MPGVMGNRVEGEREESSEVPWTTAVGLGECVVVLAKAPRRTFRGPPHPDAIRGTCGLITDNILH